MYGEELSEARKAEIHVRAADDVVARLLSLAPDLTAARSPAEKFVCRCRTYVTLAVALCRAKGIPARARCGFSTYFCPGKFEDHWVVEYWNESEWVRIDPQLDAKWLSRVGLAGRTLEKGAFLSGAEAWAKWRTDDACDVEDFGLSFDPFLSGAWFVAGNLLRDVAALCKVEMLPWDAWGAMPKPAEAITDFEFFDDVANLALDPDANLDALKSQYLEDSRLKVPPTIFNALTNTLDDVSSVSSS
mmetsp:Transcript_25682/g.79015  ORF Transcript_25682/g.79015 Transcript_25682/m.79015 type:complete len:245 (+) Transcript_25682:95-829(+)